MKIIYAGWVRDPEIYPNPYAIAPEPDDVLPEDNFLPADEECPAETDTVDGYAERSSSTYRRFNNAPLSSLPRESCPIHANGTSSHTNAESATTTLKEAALQDLTWKAVPVAH